MAKILLSGRYPCSASYKVDFDLLRAMAQGLDGAYRGRKWRRSTFSDRLFYFLAITVAIVGTTYGIDVITWGLSFTAVFLCMASLLRIASSAKHAIFTTNLFPVIPHKHRTATPDGICPSAQSIIYDVPRGFQNCSEA